MALFKHFLFPHSPPLMRFTQKARKKEHDECCALFLTQEGERGGDLTLSGRQLTNRKATGVFQKEQENSQQLEN